MPEMTPFFTANGSIQSI